MSTRARTSEQARDYAEEYFRCQHGPRMAWFELPQAKAEPIRCVYVSYVCKGNTRDGVVGWMINEVIKPLHELTKGKGYLYWRNPEEVIVTEEGDWFICRTRLVVLDENLNVMRLDNAHTEGAPYPILDKEYHLLEEIPEEHEPLRDDQMPDPRGDT